MDYKAIYEEWLSNPYFDEATKAELRAIADDDKEIRNVSTRIWNLDRRACAELSVQVLTV